MIYTIEKLLSKPEPWLRKLTDNGRISMNSVDEFELVYTEYELCDTEYDDDVIRRCIIKAIPKIIKTLLSEKEQEVISMYFYQQKKTKYIAEKMGCSSQNVLKIKQNALEKIKKYLIPLVPDKWKWQDDMQFNKNSKEKNL